MEPTRISGPQGSQGAQGTQSARGKSQAQQAGGPVDPSAQGGFLALLASLDGTLAGEGLPLDTESDGCASQTAILGSDNAVASGRADPASLAAWQSLLAPGAAVSGSASAVGGDMSALAGTDWHAAADGLEAPAGARDAAGICGGGLGSGFGGWRWGRVRVGRYRLACGSRWAGGADGDAGWSCRGRWREAAQWICGGLWPHVLAPPQCAVSRKGRGVRLGRCRHGCRQRDR